MDERWELLWAARCSQLYHARRCAYYERLAKTSDFLSIVGASTALTAIGSFFPKWVGAVGAFAVLIASSLVLVVGATSMARRHDELRRKFGELEGKIHEDADPNAAKIGRWKRERVLIEMEEPPTYWALSVLCNRELAIAAGKDDGATYNMHWFKAATCHLFLWRNS